MATLVLDRAQLEVRSDGDALALYEAGERRGSVPLKLIDRCVIQGAQTKLDSGVLLRLAEAGAATVLLSPRVGRRVALVLGPRHNDAAVRLAQAHRVLDDAYCRAWANALVNAKLRRQRRTIAHLAAQRPDARKPLFDAARLLDAALAGMTAEPASLPTLRGVEGSAARAYFAGLTSVFAPALDFTGRNRRPPRDPVNACLSLGYTLLHVQAVQQLHAIGLDPLLGFYHRPAIGRESLASDLIEPLRPAVDLWVWEQFRGKSLREEHFTVDKGACLLGKAGRQHFYAAWEAGTPPLRRWLRAAALRLARQLRAQGTALLEPWLEDDEC
jgi:CRISPR-associated protein Cas1